MTICLIRAMAVVRTAISHEAVQQRLQYGGIASVSNHGLLKKIEGFNRVERLPALQRHFAARSNEDPRAAARRRSRSLARSRVLGRVCIGVRSVRDTSPLRLHSSHRSDGAFVCGGHQGATVSALLPANSSLNTVCSDLVANGPVKRIEPTTKR